MSLFTPDISLFDTYYDKGKYLLAWRVSVAFSIVFSVLVLINVIAHSEATIPLMLVLVVAYSCVIYLKITKNFKPLFWVYAISGTVLAHFAMNYVLNFTHYVDFIWIVACTLLAFIGLGWKYGILFIIVNSAGIAFFFWFTLNTHIEVMVPRTNLELVADFIEVLFSFFVIAYLMRQFILFQTYSEKELKKAYTTLESQNQVILVKNKENVVLLKEIHHRVKNNLQIIISLLRMQSAEVKPEEGKIHFKEAINRIMTMSLIHEKLYGERELSKINLQTYFNELVEEIISISLIKDNISLQIDSEVQEMSIDLIVPLGLLVNEIVSNSLKHAFNDIDSGKITINLSQKGKVYYFSYSDNGTWKEPNVQNSSFGLELIDILTDQMNGEKTIDLNNGTHYSFILNDTTHE